METQDDAAPRSFLSLSWRFWRRAPLYMRIVLALVLGVLVGLALGPAAWRFRDNSCCGFSAPLRRRSSSLGLTVANVLEPGAGAGLKPPAATAEHAVPGHSDPWLTFVENIPKSLLGPLGDNGKVLRVIVIALAFGIALRRERTRPLGTPQDLVELFLACLVRILHWVIAIVPLAVFGIVASVIGTSGFRDFRSLGLFVLSVIVALLIQAAYYLLRIRFGSWVHPWKAIQGTRDALVMAFSTASSTATMPVTYACLKDRVGVRERSATLGALVGANFNNDGTALYEAMAALFVAHAGSRSKPCATAYGGVDQRHRLGRSGRDPRGRFGDDDLGV